MRIKAKIMMKNTKLLIFSVLVILTGLVGCGGSEDWVCKTDKNRNGDRVQFSVNTKTGEIGAASKACN